MATRNSEIVEAFEKFFQNYYDNEVKQLAQEYPNEKQSLYIDWQDLYRYDPDLADDYLSHPKHHQGYAEKALRVYDLPIDISLSQAHVRIHNLPSTESPDIGEIRSRHVNSLIRVTGTVDSIEQAQSALSEAAFECQLCGTLSRIPQSPIGGIQKPHKCQGCERSENFVVNHDQSEYVDIQTIYIEQRPPGVGTDDDREILTVKLEDDLVDEVNPGNTVNICGIVQHNADLKNSTASIPDKHIEGIAITEASRYQLDITNREKKDIIQLSSNDSIYETMVDSIAPTVYGYERMNQARSHRDYQDLDHRNTHQSGLQHPRVYLITFC
ncbi:minichromosome maintenance protein MCM [Halostagnicola sp. A56]|uniref:minichromosome maintenance protein MCM n=1 Tax=Halostagnicola sp. A56 TaxID=1495067 RepID=UPI0009E59F8E|nr:minichromosome maintenance protein MCM [Halostagnicola sp. A56]